MTKERKRWRSSRFDAKDEEIPEEKSNFDEETEKAYQYEESLQSETDRQIHQLEEEDIKTKSRPLKKHG